MENINLNEVKELIIQTEKSKIYKSVQITDTYNKIFDKKEKATNCGSCLRTYFLRIKNWYQEKIKEQENLKVSEEEQELLVDKPIEKIEDDKLQPLREEITIINQAIKDGTIEADGEEAKLSNDRLVEVIEEKKKSPKKTTKKK